MQGKPEWEEIIKEYRETEIPKDGTSRVLQAMAKAKQDRKRKWHRLARYGTIAAAALLLFIVPNTNTMLADAMAEIPMLGGFFRIITIDNYVASEKSASMDAAVPKMEAVFDRVTYETQGFVNTQMQQYVDEVIEEFKSGLQENGHGTLNVYYEVVTDTDRWLSVQLYAETVMADGNTQSRCYTIDKQRGEQLSFADILQIREGAKTEIEDEILRQIKLRTESGDVFFTEEAKASENSFLTQEQMFYVNSEGQLVIVFDEAEVAPASMGMVEFIIPVEIISLEERGE